MTAVMIGVDPHKGSHTAVAIDAAEEPLGKLRVRASASQTQRLVAWAAAWPERTWAVEGAGGLGHLLAQQLVAAGERVLDVQPKLGARVRLLASGTSLTGIFGVGPVIAATVIGDVADVARFATRDRFAAYNGTAPIEVSSGNRKTYRLSLRGNRRINHALHMAAITQIRHPHSG